MRAGAGRTEQPAPPVLAAGDVALAVLRRWIWLRDVCQQPRLLLTFAASSTLLAGNWLTCIWAVNNGHVLDASLGYVILPLVNLAQGYIVFHERTRPMLAPVDDAVLLWGQHSGNLPEQNAHTWLLFALSGPVTAIPLLLFLGTLLYGEPFAGPRLAGFGLIWTALLLYSADGWRHRVRPAMAS